MNFLQCELLSEAVVSSCLPICSLLWKFRRKFKLLAMFCAAHLVQAVVTSEALNTPVRVHTCPTGSGAQSDWNLRAAELCHEIRCYSLITLEIVSCACFQFSRSISGTLERSNIPHLPFCFGDVFLVSQGSDLACLLWQEKVVHCHNLPCLSKPKMHRPHTFLSIYRIAGNLQSVSATQHIFNRAVDNCMVFLFVQKYHKFRQTNATSSSSL